MEEGFKVTSGLGWSCYYYSPLSNIIEQVDHKSNITYYLYLGIPE